MSTTTDPRRFGRVAVAYGGNSAEREVSLDSGRNVLAALRIRWMAYPPCWMPCAPGTTHACSTSCTDAVAKMACCRVRWMPCAFRIPAAASSAPPWPWTRFAASAYGRRCPCPRLPTRPIVQARTWPRRLRRSAILLIERLIEGAELTIGILGDQALPSIRIVPAGAFYDYHAKYVAEDTRYLCPGLEGEAETEIRALAFAAFEAAGCSGWGRVDVMRDAQGNNFLLEVNTTPGMTSHSLVPKAAKATGMDFESLCWRILETSLARDAG